jgi:hypothetical protein
VVSCDRRSCNVWQKQPRFDSFFDQRVNARSIVTIGQTIDKSIVTFGYYLPRIMKVNFFLTAILFILFGCSRAFTPSNTLVVPTESNRGSSITSTNKTETQFLSEWNSVQFPLSACGDSLQSHNSTSVTVYPVFVDYSSDADLQRVKLTLCQDAYVKTLESDEQVIQTASFLSFDKANSFKQFIEKSGFTSRIGQPKVVEIALKPLTEEPESYSVDSYPVVSQEQLITISNFSESQSQQLLGIEGELFDQRSAKNIRFSVVLPAYIPDGFQVRDFLAEKRQEGTNNSMILLRYAITYINSVDQTCFEVQGTNGMFGGPPIDQDVKKVNTKAFGEIELARATGNRGGDFIAFNNAAIPKNSSLYNFNSGRLYGKDDCQTSLSYSEALKVVASLQDMNPNLAGNQQNNNGKNN